MGTESPADEPVEILRPGEGTATIRQSESLNSRGGPSMTMACEPESLSKRRLRPTPASSRVLSAPAMIYAYSVPGPNEETTQENYASVCCAVHNMALAAVAEGLVLDWSTGGISKLPGLDGNVGSGRRLGNGWSAFHWRARSSVPTSRRDAVPSIVSWLS